MSQSNQTQILTSKSPFISAYTHKLKIPISFPENSPVTKQEFKEESDINTIMARYNRTGEMPVLNAGTAQFLDVTQMDFQYHMDTVAQANQMFLQLPSSIRSRFGNDPGAFLGFCSDPQNRPELARMGLLTPEATQSILNPKPPQNASQTPSASSTENE